MIVHALAVGGLYAAGLHLLMERGWRGMVLGLVLLSHGTNLLLFTTAGPVQDGVPLVPEGMTAPPGTVPDPLVQVLILTAIVISFGMLALALVMVRQALAGTRPEDGEAEEPAERA